MLPLAALVSQADGAMAQIHKLECPAVAPAEWQVPNAPLSGVEVLSTPDDQPIDETAPPSLVPDEENLRSGTLRQSWRMNADGPGWVYFVDCLYRGTERRLRLKADLVSRCDRSISHFTKRSGETERSVQRMSCD
jgi:hypothetical protein